MSIPLLRTLVAIAESGSFTAAASQICVSQAAVGQQMKRLERELGVILFDRSQRTPRLNQLGLALIPKAQMLVRNYDTILDDLVGDARFIGELTIGAVPSTIGGLLPPVMKQLIGSFPELHIRVVPGMSGDLYEQVARGALDAAIISAPAGIDPQLRWYPFAEEELVLLTPPALTETDPMRILSDMPYIRHIPGASVGMLVEQWLANHSINPRETMVMESIETLSGMVAHGLGVSIVPNLSVPDPVFASLRKIPLGKNTLPRILGVLMRADCSKVRLVDSLREHIHLTLGK